MFMTPILTFRPKISTDSTPAADAMDRAICPGCHTADAAMTMTAVVAGAAWQCARCAQRWDVDRLAAVANYADWVAGRTPALPVSAPPPIEHPAATRVYL